MSKPGGTLAKPTEFLLKIAKVMGHHLSRSGGREAQWEMRNLFKYPG